MKQEDFKILSLDIIETVREYVNSYVNGCCDNTVGCFFGWREFYGVKYLIEDNILFIQYNQPDGEYAYASPIPLSGHIEDFVKGVEKLKQMHLEAGDSQFVLVTVTEPEIVALQEAYAGQMTFYADEDSFDYVYSSQDLMFFKGKKYHGERNHVNKFKKTYSGYKFIPLEGDLIQKAYEFCMEYVRNNPKTADTAIAEYKKIPEFFENFHKYDFLGGCLIVDDKIIGVCLAEKIKDTLFEHFEKCDSSYPGAHQALVSEMAIMFASDVTYINREDDAGDLNLRKSKLSYHPVKMVTKHVVNIKC